LAPIIPQRVRTMRGQSARTGTSSGGRSLLRRPDRALKLIKVEDSFFDLETIEREYREKKAEYRAALRAGRAWDRDHGVASLRPHLLLARAPCSITCAPILKILTTGNSGALANAVLALNTVVNVHSA
jgi:hypothetical protein